LLSELKSAPRLRAFRSRLLSRQRIQDLARVEGLEELVRLLKDSRYAKYVSSASRLEELSSGITQCFLDDVEHLKRVCGGVAYTLINMLSCVDVVKTIFSIIRAIYFEGASGLKRIPSYRLYGEAKTVYDYLAQQAYEDRERRSVRALVKRVADSIREPVIREALIQSVAKLESTEDPNVIEVATATLLAQRLLEAIPRDGIRLSVPIEKMVVPYIDYLVVQSQANLLLLKRVERALVEIALKAASPKVAEAISTSISTGSALVLYQALARAHGLPSVKLESESQADEIVYRGIFRRIRSDAELAFASYPFTPALGVAAYFLAYIEYRDLMSILALKLTGAEVGDLSTVLIAA